MAHPSRSAALFLFALLAAARTARADVLRVPADHPTPAAAVAAAAEGDTVLVSPGAYGGAIAITGKSVSIVATAPGVVLLGRVSVADLLAHQCVVLRGLELREPALGPFDVLPVNRRRVSASGCAGPVWIESCVMTGLAILPDGPAPLQLLEAVSAVRSRVVLLASSASPSSTLIPPNVQSAPAVRGEGALLAIHDSQLVATAAAAGLRLTGSRARVSGSALHGGSGPVFGGMVTGSPGLVAEGATSLAELVECEVLGALSAPPFSLSSGAKLVQHHAAARHLTSSTTLASQAEPWVLELRGLPMEVVLLGISPKPALAYPNGFLGAVLLASPVQLAAIATLNGAGRGQMVLPVPSGAPDGLFGFAQALFTGGPVASGGAALFVLENAAPVCSFSVLPGIPGTLRFDASASSDPDGAIALYAWDFGDGASASSTTPVVLHAFPGPGSYTVTLTVTDDDGASSTCSMTAVAP